MISIIKAGNGMNIAGQGIKIMLFTLPFVIAALLVQWSMPEKAAIPLSREIRTWAGLLFLIPGCLLWFTAVVQLMTVFPRGKLATNGAYGFCRNPIYASFIIFILPAIAFLTGTWIYLCVSGALWIGVALFIKKEESRLYEIFGAEYEEYHATVGRILPLMTIQR